MVIPGATFIPESRVPFYTEFFLKIIEQQYILYKHSEQKIDPHTSSSVSERNLGMVFT